MMASWGERYQSWHRSNACRAADLVAIRIGRANSPGRPIVWLPRPELMQDRRRVGLSGESLNLSAARDPHRAGGIGSFAATPGLGVCLHE